MTTRSRLVRERATATLDGSRIAHAGLQAIVETLPNHPRSFSQQPSVFNLALSIFWHYRHYTFNIRTAFVKDFRFCGFDRVALGFGHGFWFAEDHAGGTSQNFTDGPGAVFVRKEDFADALLLRTVIPAAQHGEAIAQHGEI